MRIDIDSAIKLLSDSIDIQDKTEIIDIVNASGRVCGRDIFSNINVPVVPKSAMDGYAVRSIDVESADRYRPVKLEVYKKVYAGDNINFKSKPNTAIRIMTGAQVPEGYDAIIKQEDTDYGKDVVSIFKSCKPYDNYCKIGEDIKFGQKVINKYEVLSPFHIGVLASLGNKTVEVLTSLKVIILSTGSEIIEPGMEYKEAATYNSTSYQLATILKNFGVDVLDIIHCNDDTNEIKNIIQELSNKVDVIITTGGISVGEKDLLPVVLDDLDAKILFRGVNIKPGTPVTAAKLNDSIILCCSGNPFACIVNFQVFFWPILAKKMNNNTFMPKIYDAKFTEGILKPKKYVSYTRARYDLGNVVINNDGHSSSILSTIIGNNCFIINEPNKNVNIGDSVKVQMMNLNYEF